jgi:hypothetical protein
MVVKGQDFLSSGLIKVSLIVQQLQWGHTSSPANRSILLLKKKELPMPEIAALCTGMRLLTCDLQRAKLSKI